MTKHTTMLHPFCSQVTTLQHFKTGFQVEWERFLLTQLMWGTLLMGFLTKSLFGCSYRVKRLAAALSFCCNDQSCCRAVGTLGLFSHIPCYTKTSAGNRLLSPPGNSNIPEVQIKPGRFFLPVAVPNNLPKTQCPSAQYVVTSISQALLPD